MDSQLGKRMLDNFFFNHNLSNFIILINNPALLRHGNVNLLWERHTKTLFSASLSSSWRADGSRFKFLAGGDSAVSWLLLNVLAHTLTRTAPINCAKDATSWKTGQCGRARSWKLKCLSDVKRTHEAARSWNLPSVRLAHNARNLPAMLNVLRFHFVTPKFLWNVQTCTHHKFESLSSKWRYFLIFKIKFKIKFSFFFCFDF